jgi:hypothetical protein
VLLDLAVPLVLVVEVAGLAEVATQTQQLRKPRASVATAENLTLPTIVPLRVQMP